VTPALAVAKPSCDWYAAAAANVALDMLDITVACRLATLGFRSLLNSSVP